MAYTAGATATEKALDLARESFVKHGRGESLGMPRVVVLITDGEPNRPAEATAAANALKGKGVIVFTVGIIGGDNINEANLRAMGTPLFKLLGRTTVRTCLLPLSRMHAVPLRKHDCTHA